MRKVLIFSFVLMFVPLLFGQQVVDKVVAVVEDEIILQSELSQYALNLAFQMRVDPRREPEKFEQLQEQTLQNLINQKIPGKQKFILIKKTKEVFSQNCCSHGNGYSYHQKIFNRFFTGYSKFFERRNKKDGKKGLQCGNVSNWNYHPGTH